MKVWQHLRTINHHKSLVMKHCFKVGLYKQGLLHDMSKYSPTEFLVGCRYYQGTRSPNNAEREATGYSKAWLHHKGRNKHHYEYWIDYSVDPGEGIAIEDAYEICNRDVHGPGGGASKTYQGSNYTDSQLLEYYEKGAATWQNDTPETAVKLHFLLKMLAEEGGGKTLPIYPEKNFKKMKLFIDILGPI